MDSREVWINRFLELNSSRFFCKVDKDYIEDGFHLSGINEQVPHFREALNLILDLQQYDDYENFHHYLIQRAAQRLYGLIHARYILTDRGIEKMLVKYLNGDFEYCPRIYCEPQPMLPIGLSDTPGQQSVKLYCPRCLDVYTPKSPYYVDTDGAFFGTGFPHMFFMVHPEYRPPAAGENFIPRDLA